VHAIDSQKGCGGKSWGATGGTDRGEETRAKLLPLQVIKKSGELERGDRGGMEARESITI